MKPKKRSFLVDVPKQARFSMPEMRANWPIVEEDVLSDRMEDEAYPCLYKHDEQITFA